MQLSVRCNSVPIDFVLVVQNLISLCNCGFCCDDLFQSKINFVMGSLLTRIGTTYYLKKVEQTSTVLTYKRTPSWRSLVLFIGESKSWVKYTDHNILFLQLSTVLFGTYQVSHVSEEYFTVFCACPDHSGQRMSGSVLWLGSIEILHHYCQPSQSHAQGLVTCLYTTRTGSPGEQYFSVHCLWRTLYSSFTAYLGVRVFCYVVGFYFCYIATEKYEVSIELK